jgi:NADH-quinone oxidoreductase subunit H
MIEFLAVVIIKCIIVIAATFLIAAYSTLLERKLLGHIQLRHGPKRVGFHGILQPIADGVKAMFKEELVPDNADKPLFIIAPMIGLSCALLLLVVIPFGDSITLFGREINLYLADLDIGILLVLGISTIGSYGCMLGGWSSGNKFGIIGALRASAQMISYELPLALAVIAVIMVSGTLSLVGIVESQAGLWNIIKCPFTFIAFIIFFICGLAELNRTPFDMPEAEAELACGYNVEYSSLKFALFFLAEYIHMFILGALTTTLFLGGWHGPELPLIGPGLSGLFYFFLKTFLIIFLCIWERSTFPRLRYDEVMKFGWKILLPISLFNILFTGLWLLIFN